MSMDFKSRGYRRSANWGVGFVVVSLTIIVVAGVVGFILGYSG